ncbi:hypothetical protein [Streptosporangium canum]|uniref:hypothetical protein n=1 Tax=Streptosporangium canum TaxID=324952 RepID=UPI0037A40BDF
MTYTPAQVLATELGELIDDVPASSDQPTAALAITDPQTGDTYQIKLSPEHVELLAEAVARTRAAFTEGEGE